MLILAEREQRVARVGDLWSALRYIPSFLAWAVVINVLALAAFLVILLGGWLGAQSGSNALTYLLFAGAIAVVYWITVRWVWVVPSIGDSGVSLIAAMRKSSLIVRQVGWWRTFGLLLLIIGINLGVYLVVNIVLSAAGDALPGILTGVLGLAPLIVFIAPFETCFLTNMYRASQVQAGLPDTFVLCPAPYTGGTGLAVRHAVAQVKEAARELKAGTSSQAPVAGAPLQTTGAPATRSGDRRRGRSEPGGLLRRVLRQVRHATERSGPLLPPVWRQPRTAGQGVKRGPGGPRQFSRSSRSAFRNCATSPPSQSPWSLCIPARSLK